MDLSMSWLKEYVDVDADIKDFVEDITLTGSKVEGWSEMGGEITGVITGKVLEVKKHPNADRLVICKVDIGKAALLTIVTHAPNVFEGAYVCTALDGATLPGGITLHDTDFRGVMSYGMMCSVEEMGFDRHDFPEAPEEGIYIFPEPVPLGVDVCEAMDLKDKIVEFEITSNRPDCFSTVGLAREAAATYKKEFRYPKIEVKEEAEGDINDMIEVEIKNPELCPRYIARVVKNVKVEPSPRWMRKRLRANGVRPINNIVDITNYVMLELGQPMHAFTIGNIEGKKIIVRNAEKGEKITTLDGNERQLDASMLVISDINKAVAIAGIMGGENSKVNGSSDTILFESANFSGPNIRVSAKKLGLRTDASSKYEKGLDPNLALDAVNRAVQLVEMLGCGEVVKGMVDCYPNKRESWTLGYNPEKINKFLGADISEEEMIDIFSRIELVADKATKTVKIPTFRPDLESFADLAEEVARFYGYGKIVPTLAAGTPTVGKRTYEQNISRMIKNSLISNGLCEAITYTFESPKVFDKLNIPEGDKLRDTVTISNPLGEDFSIMRTTTLNGMLTSLSTNYNRRNESAGLFEFAKIYIPKAVPVTELPDEYVKVTIGMYGNADFFGIKGIVEHTLDTLGIADTEFEPLTDIPWMHPGRTAAVEIGGERIGYVGELHPKVAKNYGIGTRAYIAVLDEASLAKAANLDKVYKPLPKFPAVVRDISMLVGDNIYVRDIEKVISANGGALLENIELFDVYKGGQIVEGSKSVSFSITFRAENKTLVDDEVNSVMTDILTALEKELGAVLRDK
ncbi:MAG: phenylalanine--tRNA ligase subunit beta [Candidatus Metalachnospira sp.]|nr:phenylalanine--tRNA ligase subunit beta [Candidatus Metalachnospira sp.]